MILGCRWRHLDVVDFLGRALVVWNLADAAHVLAVRQVGHDVAVGADLPLRRLIELLLLIAHWLSDFDSVALLSLICAQITIDQIYIILIPYSAS